MSISVTNTDAQLQNSTILTEEDTATIEALHTYARGSNPPFAVSSGSAAKVDNLDADKLDGQEGVYYLSLVNASNWATASLTAASYAPTFGAVTVGNGTVSGSYLQIGKLVFWQATLTLGSTSSVAAGPVTVTLPVTASSTTSAAANVTGIAYDVSAGPAQYPARGAVNTTSAVIIATNASSMAGYGTSVPFAWADTDVLVVGGIYIAA